jgi:hypothetical protein
MRHSNASNVLLVPQSQANVLLGLQGATIINGARGKHMVEADVLAALDAGQVCPTLQLLVVSCQS